MKIIVSHDVDHLYNTDHLKDLYFPKLLIRSSFDLIKKTITRKEFVLRFSTPFKKRINRIHELVQFDKENNVKSTFFFGMANGFNLSYSQKKALPMINYVINEGFDVGVHGIEANNIEGIKKEFDDFRRLTAVNVLGIRLHYVRFNDDTLEKLNKVGYKFDTSEFDKTLGYTIKKHYKDGIWEFPLCLMDSYLPYDINQAKKKSLEVIDRAETLNLEYFTILFHDIYFSEAYSVYFDWYKWIIKELKNKGYEFISYSSAVDSLEKM